MLFCQHRVNDPAQLANLPREFGVEIDLRSDGGRLLLEHDAFVPGPTFDDWLDEYAHAFIVLNVKEEGLERRISATLDARGIDRWAFLDQSFPFLVRSLRANETRTMVRLSEYESVSTAASLSPHPEWVWVDSFTGMWPGRDALQELSAIGYRFMIVSPELQGRDPAAEVQDIRGAFSSAGATIDGVCSKRPELWL